MATIPAPILFVVGIVALLGGGHWLVEGAVQLARGLGVSTLLIGLTVVAFGTSSPELSFNVISAWSGSTELSFGNVVGSNIANITLVLGIAALIRPLDVHSRVIRKELPLLIVVSLGLMAMAWAPFSSIAADGREIDGFSRVDGAILLAAFGGMSWIWYRLGKNDRSDALTVEMTEEAADEPLTSTPVAVTQVVVGLVALLAGGKLTQMGAVGIAASWGLAETAVGLTIVAFVTSLPEVVTSVIAARRGHGDLAVGNVVGSNLFNILLVLGATSAVLPIPVPEPWGGWDLIIMFAITLVLLPMSLHQRSIVRWEGALLLSCYVSYVVWTLVR